MYTLCIQRTFDLSAFNRCFCFLIMCDHFRDRLGMFDVAGTRAWLGTIRASQEVLSIPGPVTKDLLILVNITNAVL